MAGLLLLFSLALLVIYASLYCFELVLTLPVPVHSVYSIMFGRKSAKDQKNAWRRDFE